MEITISDLLILAFLSFIFYTIKTILPNYFREKGKNLATKQDISEITKIVEDVKHKFTVETEYLKSKLSTHAKINTKLVEEEINSIIAINNAIYEHYYMLVDPQLNGINMYKNEELENLERELALSYNKISISQTRLNLYIEDKKIREDVLMLKQLIVESVAGPIRAYIIKLKLNNKLNAINENRTGEEKINFQKKLDDERLMHAENFYKELNKTRQPILAALYDFQNVCRNYIKKLLEIQQDPIN